MSAFSCLIVMIATSLISINYSQNCESGEFCIIRCNKSTGNCSNNILNGTISSFLTVHCEEDNYCTNTTINCPIGGCNITCNAKSVCNNAIINFAVNESIESLIGSNNNINILCQQWLSCSNLMMNAQYADNININCISDKYDAPCFDFILNAQNANKVVINLDGDAPNVAIWNVQYVKLIQFNAIRVYHAVAELHAEYAESVIITLSDSVIAPFIYFYLPSNTTFNCYGYGCRMDNIENIHLTTDASQFQLNVFTCNLCHTLIDCVNFQSLQGILLNNSKDITFVTETQIGRYDDSVCDRRSIFGWTDPVYNGTLDIGCIHGKECYVSCNIFNCSDQGIDGSLSSFLSVTCESDEACMRTTIICPNGGCNITCSAEDTCLKMKIIYNGFVEDKGEINIQCRERTGCQDMVIDANYVYSVSLNCTASSLYDDDYGFESKTCYHLSLYAMYANQVNIIAINRYALFFSDLYVYNTTSLFLSSYGEYGFYLSNLYASYAISVVIQCIAHYSCRSDLYLPSNAELICYGNECFRDLYVMDGVQDLNLSLKDVNDCCGIQDCLTLLDVFCGNGYVSQVAPAGLSDNYPCNEICGCAQFVSSVSFDGQQCDQDNETKKQLTNGEISGIIIGSTVFVGVVMVALYAATYFAKKNSKNNGGIQQNGGNNNGNVELEGLTTA